MYLKGEFLKSIDILKIESHKLHEFVLIKFNSANCFRKMIIIIKCINLFKFVGLPLIYSALHHRISKIHYDLKQLFHSCIKTLTC